MKKIISFLLCILMSPALFPMNDNILSNSTTSYSEKQKTRPKRKYGYTQDEVVSELYVKQDPNKNTKFASQVIKINFRAPDKADIILYVPAKTLECTLTKNQNLKSGYQCPVEDCPFIKLYPSDPQNSDPQNKDYTRDCKKCLVTHIFQTHCLDQFLTHPLVNKKKYEDPHSGKTKEDQFTCVIYDCPDKTKSIHNFHYHILTHVYFSNDPQYKPEEPVKTDT